MTDTHSSGEQAAILVSASAVERALEGIVLSRLLAETGLELLDARFVETPDGRGLCYALGGPDAVSLAETLVAALRSQLAAEIDLSPAIPEAIPLSTNDGEERTLVLLKPDNFEFPSIRPGALLDHFARTGLTVDWMRVHPMSLTEAEEFYGPVLPQLEGIFRETHGGATVEFLEREFGETLSPEDRDTIQSGVGPIMARLRWEGLIEFMTGQRPSDVPDSEKSQPGSRKCLALVYRGENAVARIRSILGPTDPAKAPGGTIRREFGRALMINAAHASDSVENALREMRILGITPSDS